MIPPIVPVVTPGVDLTAFAGRLAPGRVADPLEVHRVPGITCERDVPCERAGYPHASQWCWPCFIRLMDSLPTYEPTPEESLEASLATGGWPVDALGDDERALLAHTTPAHEWAAENLDPGPVDDGRGGRWN